MMNKIGVYKITNIKNGKFYIGSTSTIGFEKRWKKHILDLNKNCHHSIYLQRAWNKYGKDNFLFEIIERCNPKKCIKREQYYLDKLNPQYNLCEIAGSTLGYKYPKSYCKKLKEIRKGKNNPFYGKHHTEETKEKIRNSLIGKVEGKKNGNYGNGDKIRGTKNPFYGKCHSEKTKKTISMANKGRFLSDKSPNFGGYYKFFHKKYNEKICGKCDLVREFNLDRSHVNSICNGKRKSHHGWKCLGKFIVPVKFSKSKKKFCSNDCFLKFNF